LQPNGLQTVGASKARLADRRRATRSVRACTVAAITAPVSVGRPVAATEQMIAPTPQPPGVPVTPEQAAARNSEPAIRLTVRPGQMRASAKEMPAVFVSGFGLANTHGAAGFASGEAYKLGAAYPYIQLRRYFIRQTIDLGGESQKVNADINRFPGSQTENRLVLTVSKFAVVDIFDTNQYTNNPKTDFLNWSLINAGTFDYAADAWGYTYGTAAEWYQGDAERRHLRFVGNAHLRRRQCGRLRP
jgi:hypothetical protein